MAKYELTNKAVEDLADIWEYTLHKWSEKQADKYYNQVLQRCQDIADKPDLGKNYNGITKDLFGLKINKHIIFYRKRTDQPLEVTRVLHGQMDLKKKVTE
jgi:toxin ParE1/3/4